MVKRSGSSSGSKDGASKKSKAGPGSSHEDLKDALDSAISAVLALKSDATGDAMLASFLKVPPKKIYPDYYTIVANPIAISDIQRNLAKGKYHLKDAFIADFKLMLDNALTYNDPDSWIVADARTIYTCVENTLATAEHHAPLTIKLKQNVSANSPPTDLITEKCLEVINDVVNHDFPEDGIISSAFLDDVDLVAYPDYSLLVKQPTSFNNVRALITKRKLFNPRGLMAEHLQKFHDETVRIFTNAQLYNDPSAMIYQDSIKLHEYFEEKYAQLVADLTPSSSATSTSTSKNKRKEKSVATPAASHGLESDLGIEAEIGSGPDVGIDDDGLDLSLANLVSNLSDEEAVDDVSSLPANSGVPLIPLRDLIIQELSIASSQPVVSHVLQLSHKNERNGAALRLVSSMIHQNLFPTHPPTPITTFFEYKVPANGLETNAYTIALPADVLPFVSFKVALHNLVYAIKKADLVNGKGVLSTLSDEDFQCKLFVNEEEVSNGGLCYEDKRQAKRAEWLGLQYDVRLVHGLNVIDFECMVAPALSRKIKHTPVESHSDENAGRHTRHQLQQLKMTWDVEKITFYVICNAM